MLPPICSVNQTRPVIQVEPASSFVVAGAVYRRARPDGAGCASGQLDRRRFVAHFHSPRFRLLNRGPGGPRMLSTPVALGMNDGHGVGPLTPTSPLGSRSGPAMAWR